MYHPDWFYLRYELKAGYPGQPVPTGSILNASEFEGEVYIKEGGVKIFPNTYPMHFRKLKWWEHRTIEELLSIKYMKVKCSGCGYYGNGDIVEVIDFMYNNPTIVGGRNALLFNLKGHHYIASQLEPATQEEHDDFWQKERNKIK